MEWPELSEQGMGAGLEGMGIGQTFHICQNPDPNCWASVDTQDPRKKKKEVKEARKIECC